jgi:cold shock protein
MVFSSRMRDDDGVVYSVFSGRRRQVQLIEEVELMPEGTIKRLTDKGFGFIDTGTGNDIFFHMSNLEGVRYDDLREGQRVTYTAGQGPKGPRAENVKPAN